MYKFRDHVVPQIYKPYIFHSWRRSLRSHHLLPPATVNQRYLAPRLSLECTSCPVVPPWEPCLRIHPWQNMCFGDHLNRIDDLTPLRPLYELLRSSSCDGGPRQTSPGVWVPLHITPAPEHLWSSASSLRLSLPFKVHGQLWTNIRTHTHNLALKCIY